MTETCLKAATVAFALLERKLFVMNNELKGVLCAAFWKASCSAILKKSLCFFAYPTLQLNVCFSMHSDFTVSDSKTNMLALKYLLVYFMVI